MHNHLMIDLETLGVVPGCAITQIGLAAFSVDSDDIESTLIRVDMDSCFEHGLFAQGSTIRWWLKQSEAARASMAEDGGEHIADALHELCLFYDEHTGDKTRIWSHGASFDEPILQVAAYKIGCELPWKHWNVRDTRTLAELAPNIERVKPEIAHNAESDAIAQARWVQNMLCDLKKA